MADSTVPEGFELFQEKGSPWVHCWVGVFYAGRYRSRLEALYKGEVLKRRLVLFVMNQILKGFDDE